MERDTGVKIYRCERAENAKGTAKGGFAQEAGGDDSCGLIWV